MPMRYTDSMKIRTALISSALALGIIMLAGIALFAEPSTLRGRMEAFVGGANEFTFEVADTDEKRIAGLSGRTDIPHDYGLLFVFEEPGYYGFWMVDMQEAIDILWLSDDGTILGINASVAPETYPEVFYPPQPVRHVLETRAGEAERQRWNVADRIELPTEGT
jgi:uncharacterized membrane protein (UPF0127 family)